MLAQPDDIKTANEIVQFLGSLEPKILPAERPKGEK